MRSRSAWLLLLGLTLGAVYLLSDDPNRRAGAVWCIVMIAALWLSMKFESKFRARKHPECK